MRKLDLYVVGKFIQSVFFVNLVVIALYVVINIFDNLNRYLDANVPLRGFIVLYTLKLPEIISQIFPITVFLGLMFTLIGLAKSSEITAMLSSGISLYRITAPILLLTAVFTCGHFFFSQIVAPQATRSHYDKRYSYLHKKKKLRVRTNEVLYHSNELICYMKSFKRDGNIGNTISLQKIDKNKIVWRIDAPQIIYREKGWILKNYEKRFFIGDSILYTTGDSLKIDIDIKPSEILELKRRPTELGYFELDAYMEKQRRLGINVDKWEIERSSKISYSFIMIILVLVGLPFATKSQRSSIALSIIVSILIAFFYYLLIIVFKNLGSTGDMNHIVAAWLPNLIFCLLGLFLFWKARS